ncbi:MAG: MCE family protein [Propionibacteriales bacterium]|nr:MCE family protein [Propionibacteriales bacterium]
MSLNRRARRLRLLVGVMAVALVAVAVASLPGSDRPTITVTADFADTTGIYVGNEVQYLGVPIGKVIGVVPRGSVMAVQMKVDAGTPVPAEAGAEILQSSLLTDRFVQLGPAYEGGARLTAGAHIAASRTRSPVSIDGVGKAIDDLVVALDQTGPGGHDIGDLLHATATTFDGNGAKVHDLLVSSQRALAAINDKAPDLKAIVANLSVVARTLGARDATIRRFTKNLATSTRIVAGQSASLNETLASLEDLTGRVGKFVDENGAKLTGNLRSVSEVAQTIRQHQGALAEIFNLMPTGSENVARAFDQRRGMLRVQIALRDLAVFSNLARSELCQSLVGPACLFLFNPNGTGTLDGLTRLILDLIPGRLFPWQ